MRNEVKVRKVVRDSGKVVMVEIECGPFLMCFGIKHNQVSLLKFSRFDASKDEEYWIPSYFFKPAIKKARAIFAENKKQGIK